ncbi:S26 family signal peptidase [Caulobacter radicis]|uniref:S26 family signal peptidase n=1 Tax=Caulobacter radicis TaxID=2172650 RepID=UPI000D573552|nr:S26 family signal peptidase [Caulobacter radicis]PVM84453.1 S26 family signal peptidase [Caulobacter radicis]
MSSRLLTPRGQILVAVTAGAMVALAAPLMFDPAPRLVWNASASTPVGLWRIRPGAPVEVGDHVLAEPPPAARSLAAQRGYLPANVPMIKAVGAVSGDKVCARGAWIEVNDKPVALRRPADRRGRRLPWWRGCERLSDGDVLLLNPTTESFDGRYFGPLSKGAIIGRATPLWLP